jgi:hypothetical protein
MREVQTEAKVVVVVLVVVVMRGGEDVGGILVDLALVS